MSQNCEDAPQDGGNVTTMAPVIDAYLEAKKQSRLTVVHVELSEANDLVTAIHRHHKKVTGHRWSCAVKDDDGLVRGVAIVGRPVARKTDQHAIVEVLRVATDGCPNACSALYGAVCRQQKALGYCKAMTFTLISEPGTSLRAAGWKPVATTPGRSWSVPSRAREDDHPLGEKIKWECACSELPAIDLPAHIGRPGGSDGD